MSSTNTINTMQQGVQVAQTLNNTVNGAANGISRLNSLTSATSSTTRAAGGANTGVTGNLGAYLSAAQTALNVAKVLDSNASGEDKAAAIRDQVGLAVADYYTCGLASQFYGFAQKHWPGTMKKLSDFDSKYNISTRILAFACGYGDKDMWKTEQNKMKALMEKGIQVARDPNEPWLARGRTKEELIDKSVPLDFVGMSGEGRWVNNKFADSRSESDLTPLDIWGYAGFYEKFGNDWLGTYTAEARFAICQKALELGVVNEHHGTIDINWTPELETFAQEIKGAQVSA